MKGRASLVLAFVLAVASSVHAAPPVLDRIVAVVGKKPILLSEVRVRATPFLKQLADKTKKTPTDAELAELHRQIVQRMIDEIVVAEEAEKLRITVTDADVSDGIKSIAASSNVPVATIYEEVERAGMTRAQYEEEIRRQIVEGKWMLYAVRPRMRDVPADPKAYAERLEQERAKEVARLRKQRYVEVRP